MASRRSHRQGLADDIAGVPAEKVNKDRLYRGPDRSAFTISSTTVRGWCHSSARNSSSNISRCLADRPEPHPQVRPAFLGRAAQESLPHGRSRLPQVRRSHEDHRRRDCVRKRAQDPRPPPCANRGSTTASCPTSAPDGTWGRAGGQRGLLPRPALSRLVRGRRAAGYLGEAGCLCAPPAQACRITLVFPRA